jgi:hypothetical protein
VVAAAVDISQDPAAVVAAALSPPYKAGAVGAAGAAALISSFKGPG